MDQPERKVEHIFTQPWGQITLMLFSLGLVGFGVYIAFPTIWPVVSSNVMLNFFILMVFTIGVAACFWQVAQLIQSVSWIEGFVGERPGHEMTKAPRLLAPLAALLRTRGARMQIGSSSSQSILDSVATRIDEARDITRYIVNLLIFLGLLGTFYGLATTVPAVVETIRSLAPREGDTGVLIFARLMAGLEGQMAGMGVAFSSSLIGLAGSLVVGLLELFASHGQNRFYRELEEWLSTITRLGFSSGDSESSGNNDQAVALMEHFSEQMEAMQSLFAQSDVSRSLADERMMSLTDSIDRMVKGMGRGAENSQTSSALMRIADGQDRLVRTLETQAEVNSEDMSPHVDAESRMRLRSIDVQLLRILEEMSAGRQESLSDLRSDFAALTRAVHSATEGTSGERG